MTQPMRLTFRLASYLLALAAGALMAQDMRPINSCVMRVPWMQDANAMDNALMYADTHCPKSHWKWLVFWRKR
jgi:hypothetical protein